MSISLLLVIIVLVGASAFFFLRKKQPANNSKRKQRRTRTAKTVTAKQSAEPAKMAYAANAIIPGPNACEAASALEGERFLSKDSPILPLDTCTDVANCECKYQHFEDRRTNDGDRRAPGALITQLYAQGDDKPERRDKRGRRKSDWS